MLHAPLQVVAYFCEWHTHDDMCYIAKVQIKHCIASNLSVVYLGIEWSKENFSIQWTI